MSTAPKPADSTKATDDAASKAFIREQSAQQKGENPPVKQHNPDDKGINPGQKGPAQPRKSTN